MKAKKKNLATAHTLDALHAVIAGRRRGDPATSYTAKLFRRGTNYVAKKLAEEAIEVVIDAMNGEREAVVRESADLLYNLVVLWAEAGVRPQDVFSEMARRERLFGLANEPKQIVRFPRGDHNDLDAHGAQTAAREFIAGAR